MRRYADRKERRNVMKRSTKWYRMNEKDIMNRLGLKNTKGSGGGWIEKEDGYSDNVICQLKSTDKESIKINRLDIERLEHNAIISHKLPVFAIQFINRDIYILVKPRDIQNVAKFIDTRVIDEDSNIYIGNVQHTKRKIMHSGAPPAHIERAKNVKVVESFDLFGKGEVE